MRTFESMLLEGKLTEVKIARYFMSRGYEIIDRSDDIEYQNKDIDFEIVMGNQTLGIEVKADQVIHKSKNILIEDGMDRYSGYFPGWLHKCEADILCYHDDINDSGFLLHWKKLKTELKDNFTKRRFYNRYDDCDGYIYLVPISEAIRLKWVLEQYKL